MFLKRRKYPIICYLITATCYFKLNFGTLSTQISIFIPFIGISLSDTSAPQAPNADPPTEFDPAQYLEVQNTELGNFNLLDFPDNWPFDTAKGDTFSVSHVNGEDIVNLTVPVVQVDVSTYNAIQDSSFDRFVALSNNLTGVDSSTTCPEEFTNVALSNNLTGVDSSTTCPDFSNVLSPVLSQQIYDDPFESLDSMFPNSNDDDLF